MPHTHSLSLSLTHTHTHWYSLKNEQHLEQELLQARQNCATQVELIETYTVQSKQLSMQLLEAQKRHETSVFVRSDMQMELDTADAHLLQARTSS